MNNKSICESCKSYSSCPGRYHTSIQACSEYEKNLFIQNFKRNLYKFILSVCAKIQRKN